MALAALVVFALMLLGPGVALYGAVIIARKQVRLSRRTTLNGGTAVLMGLVTILAGVAFTCFFWFMGRFLPY
jgi:hypothetical protein